MFGQKRKEREREKRRAEQPQQLDPENRLTMGWGRYWAIDVKRTMRHRPPYSN